MKRVGLSADLGTLAGATPVPFRLRANTIADSFAQDMPIGNGEGGFVDRLELDLSGLAPAPPIPTAAAFLTWDAAGDLLASNLGTQDIERGQTTTTDGGCIFPVVGDFPLRDGATPGELWAWISIDVGQVPAATVRAYWRDEVD